jgi:Ala-tRNA(Pro) deacylase
MTVSPTLSTPVTPSEILAWLDGLGIAHDTRRHEAVFTVEESRHVSAGIPGAHTKNLFVKDKKGRLFLVVAEHERRIDLKRLHEVIGASGRLSFGNAEQLMAALGVTPGSVTALSVINDRAARAVTVVLDDGLMQADRINCHPLINTMTTGLAREGLLAVFRATGHEPLILTLPAPPADAEQP